MLWMRQPLYCICRQVKTCQPRVQSRILQQHLHCVCRQICRVQYRILRNSLSGAMQTCHLMQCTAYCICSVNQSYSPVSIPLVSLQRNVVKETWRTRSSIVIWEWRNDTLNAIGCRCCCWIQSLLASPFQVQYRMRQGTLVVWDRRKFRQTCIWITTKFTKIGTNFNVLCEAFQRPAYPIR